MFRGLVGENRPVKGVLTMPDTIKACKDKHGWINVPRWKPWDSLELLEAQNARRPLTWSVQAALLHAGERHKEIHLYGVDLCGVQDVAGYRGEERTDDRWARERKDLLSTLAVLSEHGVTVKRITWTNET